MKKCKLLLFDLDGTLLQSDKTISTRTLSALKKCRGNDILIGVSTSRSEQNSLVFLNELMPDILISSGGALVKYKTEYIYRAEFSEEETNVMIDMARNICGNDCEITIDTIDAHYWNYKIDPKKLDKSWGDSIYTDFSDFNECSLKMCVEIFNQDKADKLARSLSDCDCIRFSDGFWYKFTKKNVTKENAIMKITEVCGFSTDSIIAFGDDYADIGMLELCGTGVAMGNAIDEVKERADIVIGSNDEEGIADFIENEKFESLFELANYFFWDNIYDPGQYVKRKDHFEYYAFQVSRVFLSILSDLKQEMLEFLAKQPPANFESLNGKRRQALEEEKQFILDKISYYRNKGDSILQSAKNDSAELHARYEAEFEAWKSSPEYREGLRKKQAISNYVQKESEGDGVK